MKAGKSSNQALFRTLLNKDALNFATRRLLKDLEEFQNNKLPTVGVTARNLDDDLFVWHANIRGPEGTPYEGGVFHLELRIPETYPHAPPVVELFNDLPHPNVFGRKVCIDMLDPAPDRTISQGWSSAYSIMSVLIQLQSFLFEKFYDDKEKEKLIKKAVDDANQYKCTRKSCKHGGKLAAFPPFNTNEVNPEAFKIFESEKSLFEKELKCYHTRATYKENQLGIGLSITRIPRTGLIRQASPTLDYISIKAFMKEGIRESVINEKFSHWLPIYFGTDRARTLHLAKKAISMICTSHTKRFKEEMVLEVLPKIIITLIYQMMDEKRHCSINVLRLLTQIHLLYLLFLEEYPNLKNNIEQLISEFISDEKKRHKDFVPNLGSFLAHLLVAPKAEFSKVIESYTEEQIDRQVYWLIRDIPELNLESTEDVVDAQRTTISFKKESTSYHITLFYYMFISFLKKKFGNYDELYKYYQNNFGILLSKYENEIQKQCFEILKVDSYQKYYEYLGLGKVDDQAILKRLKQAIKNSKRKKYHGTDDEILKLPSSEEQLKKLEESLPKTLDLINDKNELKELPELEWKKLCTSRWMWIRELCEDFEETTAYNVALISDEIMRNKAFKLKDELEARHISYVKDFSKLDYLPDLLQRYSKNFTWKELFLKMDLEYHLTQMDNNPDFKNFYIKLEITNKYITSLVIPIISIKNLRSGHHYLTALLTGLTCLKHIQIVGLAGQTTSLSLAALKCLAKGFNNFIKAGGKLEALVYQNFTVAGNTNDLADKLFSPIKLLTSLSEISIKGNNMLAFHGGKALSSIITTHKNLIELNLTNANLTQEIAKEIADGLMRAKQIQKIDLSYNNSIGSAGISSIVYNLAFSPKLIYLNLSNLNISSGHKEIVESLYKLLTISASLEILKASNFNQLNPNLTKVFFQSIGENRTLRILDIAYSGRLGSTNCNYLGKSIAFNARKLGLLEIVNLNGDVIGSQDELRSLYNSMLISDYDHEEWYGDQSKLNKMSGKDFEKVYHNNLKMLQLNKSSLATNFNINNWRKYNNPQDPEFVKLLARSKELENVQLSQANLQKSDADILLLALNPQRPSFLSKIKILNLSRNNLGKDGLKTLASVLKMNNILEVLDISANKLGVAGAQCLAEALKENKTIKYLNLFANKIDVDGARSFEKALSVNSTLEFIDFGHNRLRDEGIMALARGISANKTSAIKFLGLRFNFISEDGIIDFLKKLYNNNKKNSLQAIYIRNNSIGDYGLFNISKVVTNLNIKLHIDSFDKFKLLDSDILERTIWVHPAVGTPDQIKEFFEHTHQIGLVLNVRQRTGPKWANRNQQPNKFYFIEFADPTSVTRALYLASRKKAFLAGTNFRIYKAGSGTYYYTKPKKSKISKTNIFRDPMFANINNYIREERRGRGRGRVRNIRTRGRGGPRGGFRGGASRGGERGRGRGRTRE